MHVVLLALGLWLTSLCGLAAPSAAPVQPWWMQRPPLSVVSRQGPWTFYSHNVNQIECADTQGGETWIGTRLGVKRLDRDGKTRRIYTRADGLPGDVVIALAVEPRDGWAVVSDAPWAHYSLCHLDRAADRWETLREVPVSGVSGFDVGSAPSFIALGPDAVAFVLGNVARSRAGKVLMLWDRGRRAWTDVSWEKSRHTTDPYAPYPEPTCALAYRRQNQGQGILVGTYQGVARYDVGAGAWHDFLPELAVVGAARTPDGALWLATVPRPALGSQGRLSLVRLDPDTGAVGDERAVPGGEEARYFIERAVVPTDDGALWLVPHRPEGHFGGGSPLPPLVPRLDTRTGVWRTVDLLTAGAGDVPTAVWGAAVQAGVDLPMDEAARRLPGWLGPAPDLPADVAASEDPFYRARLEDGGDVWTVPFEEAHVLIRTGKAGVARRFPLPETPLPMNPRAGAVAVVDRTLLVLTTEGLWRRALPDGPWRAVPLPVRVSAYGDRLIPAGKAVLIATDDGVFRLRPADGLVTPAPALSPAQAAPDSSYLSPRPLPPGVPAPDPGFSASWDRSSVGVRVGLAAGRVWYVETFQPDGTLVARSARHTGPPGPPPPGYSVVAGYNEVTRSWSAPLRFDRPVSRLSLYETSDAVYLAVGERVAAPSERRGVGDVYRFTRVGGRWESIVPPFPGDGTGDAYGFRAQLASLDAHDVWLLDPQTTTLRRWDRARRAWTSFPSHVTFAGGSTPDGDRQTARDGDTFYVASYTGLYRFDIPTGRWTPLPLPIPASHARLLLRDVDDRAVWALCSADGFYAARLDKTTGTWRVWDRTDGFPVDGDARDLVGDGVSALASSQSGVWRLDPRTGRWADLSPSLARALPPDEAKPRLAVLGMVRDGGDVWLRAGVRAPNGVVTGPPQLARWDARRRAFDVSAPPAPAGAAEPPRGAGLTAGGGSVWLPDGGGVWHFVKATRAWQFLTPPSGLGVPPRLDWDRLQRTPDGSLWLIGRDALLRWDGP